MDAARSAPAGRSRALRATLPALLALIVITVLVWGPALVATSVTARQQPGSFVAKPWLGWQFVGAVLSDAPSAELPSPGAALEQARQVWATDDGYEASSARLVFLPDGTTIPETRLAEPTSAPVGAAGMQAGNPLAWIVEGTDERTGTRGDRVLGVLDYSSGEVRYDARQREEARTT